MHKKRYIFPKRIFDIAFSSFVIVAVLSWLTPLVALIIFFESGEKTFFKQERIGKNWKPFYIYKFKSMVGYPPVNDPLLSKDEEGRITTFGRIMRKYRIDEFPQFINVIKGDMSIVGPRPEVPFYVNMYNAAQQKILEYKPGITDYASLAYFHENEILANSTDPKRTYIEEIMPAKIAVNQRYLTDPDLFKDLKIIWLTAKKIIGL